MKLFYCVLFVLGVCFCVLGLLGHIGGFVAGALSFFAATMIIVGKRIK